MKKPNILKEEIVFKGKRISLLNRTLVINGEVITKEVVVFGEAVAILPFIDKRNIIMLKQYRAPVNEWIIEIPAGKVEAGEEPIETVKRELIEETGYVPKRIEKLISIYTSPGYSNEVLHIYVAKDLEYVGAKPERYELIEVIKLDFDKAFEMVLRERVADAKTVVALSICKIMKCYEHP